MSCGNNCAGCNCGSGDATGANAPTKGEVNAYFDALILGIEMFAWWKDGTQYVGTNGKMLKEAVAEIEAERAEALSK
jgi:hypothetical protein